MYNELKQLEKRLARLERQERKRKVQNVGTQILLDFNEENESDPDKIFLFATVPPQSEWYR